jgi:hypothetical protein
MAFMWAEIWSSNDKTFQSHSYNRRPLFNHLIIMMSDLLNPLPQRNWRDYVPHVHTHTHTKIYEMNTIYIVM